jgi:hypothetical protein
VWDLALIIFGFLINYSTYDRAPWKNNHSLARPLVTQDKTIQKEKDKPGTANCGYQLFS